MICYPYTSSFNLIQLFFILVTVLFIALMVVVETEEAGHETT